MAEYKKITVEEVAECLGVRPKTIQEYMTSGYLPIGIVKKGERNSYTIIPKMLYDATGLALGGYEPPVISQIDAEKLAEIIRKQVETAVQYELHKTGM